MKTRTILIITLLFWGLLTNAQKIHFSKGDGGFWIKENGQNILFFNRNLNDSIPSHARCNYFHPVYDLKGNCITEDFPADHLHHRGIFWAWLQIIIDGQNVADGWHLQNFGQDIDQVEFVTDANGNGVFNYSSFWHTADKPDNPLMRENTKVVVYPRALNYRQIDFTIELRALENKLQIGGSTSEKGYGGFSIRLKTDEHTQFTDSKKEKVIPINLSIASDRLMNISNPKQKSGVTIIAWEQNPGTSEWILRQEGSAQNVAWPGQTPVDVLITKPLVLKYTILLHNGKPKRLPLKYFLEKTAK